MFIGTKIMVTSTLVGIADSLRRIGELAKELGLEGS